MTDVIRDHPDGETLVEEVNWPKGRALMPSDPEVASYKVLMSPELMLAWASRSTRGDLLTWEWGAPDADGFYTPTITTHADDNLAEKACAVPSAPQHERADGR